MQGAYTSMTKNTTFEDAFSEEIWNLTYKDHNDININSTFRRVATALASVEETDELKAIWEDNFYDMLSDFKTTTGGRIYANAGTEFGGTGLINCYVAPRNSSDIDSIEGIYENLINQAQTLKSEGGWGENFSYIRPRGAFIHGVGVESPGVLKFAELFDVSSDIITSGSGKVSKNKKAKGKIRKGAQMFVLDVHHPDIVEFITAKQTPGRLTKFNVSVNCSDEFMNTVIRVTRFKEMVEKAGEQDNPTIIEDMKNLDEWELKFPDTTFKKYKKEWTGDLQAWEEKGYPVVVFDTVSATWLWDLIMKSTYNRAEPGVLFMDRANYYNPLNYAEKISATNPCGEQFLAPAGICCLGSINLTQFINKNFTDINYTKLKKYVGYLVRFLDNVNTYSNVPLPEYKDSMTKKRRIGVGLLGYGSLLFMLKMRYGSDEADVIRTKIMKIISRTAYESSIDLAIEKGMFEYCDPEKHADAVFVKNLDLSDEYMEKLRTTGIRNSSLLSVQPTGNTSILANVVSGGLEPIFMPEYVRTMIVPNTPEHMLDVTPRWYEGEFHETTKFKFVNEGDEEILKAVIDGITYKIDKNRGLTKEVLCEDYGVRHLKARKEWHPKRKWAATTTELSPAEHIRELEGFAKYVDSACSKTINLPYDYSYDDFKNLYIDAYNTGFIKGLTTYRAGTMTTVLAAKDEKNASDFDEEIILDDVKLPTSAPAMMKTIKAEGKKWYLTVILNDQQTRPFALFVTTNSHEKNVTTDDGIDRLLELASKKNIPHQFIDETVVKISTESNSSKISRTISLLLRHGVLIKNIVATLDQMDTIFVGSFLFQIKKFLGSYIKDGESHESSCGECGGDMVFSEGCIKCQNCGSSKCG